MIRIPEYLERGRLRRPAVGRVRARRSTLRTGREARCASCRARLVQGVAHLASRSRGRSPRAGRGRARETRSSWRPWRTVARGRSWRSHAAGGWERREAGPRPAGPSAHGRLAGRRDDGRAAFVEMADAPGCPAWLPPSGTRRATTRHRRGLRAVLDPGSGRSSSGIGGGATTDGGAGLRALGRALVERRTGPRRGRRDLAGLDRRLPRSSLRIASDVTNPLLGPSAARPPSTVRRRARTGTDVADPRCAARALRRCLEAATGRHERETPGAGAAGGRASASCASRPVSRRSRSFRASTWSWRETGFERELGRADLVITGEGRIDAQTAFGKTALGVARRAQGGRRAVHRRGRRRRPPKVPRPWPDRREGGPGPAMSRRPSRRRSPPGRRLVWRCGDAARARWPRPPGGPDVD